MSQSERVEALADDRTDARVAADAGQSHAAGGPGMLKRNSAAYTGLMHFAVNDWA